MASSVCARGVAHWTRICDAYKVTLGYLHSRLPEGEKSSNVFRSSLGPNLEVALITPAHIPMARTRQLPALATVFQGSIQMYEPWKRCLDSRSKQKNCRIEVNKCWIKCLWNVVLYELRKLLYLVLFLHLRLICKLGFPASHEFPSTPGDYWEITVHHKWVSQSQINSSAKLYKSIQIFLLQRNFLM